MRRFFRDFLIGAVLAQISIAIGSHLGWGTHKIWAFGMTAAVLTGILIANLEANHDSR